MKIICYSDMHLEFGYTFTVPSDDSADVLVLAGDMISFNDPEPLSKLLNGWNKPVVFVAGNHECYTNRDVSESCEEFKLWLREHHPNVHFLQNESAVIQDVHFFGGTMWTDYNQSAVDAMTAGLVMPDYRWIKIGDQTLTPQDTVVWHEQFVATLVTWLREYEKNTRVVVTHHAPMRKPNSRYVGSKLTPAFNATDTPDIITHYQPDLWIYGHTHECDNRLIGRTRIVSNQRGYRRKPNGFFECDHEFDPNGSLVDLGS